jgi:hypothetical protein
MDYDNILMMVNTFGLLDLKKGNEINWDSLKFYLCVKKDLLKTFINHHNFEE